MEEESGEENVCCEEEFVVKCWERYQVVEKEVFLIINALPGAGKSTLLEVVARLFGNMRERERQRERERERERDQSS
jgi:ABC-type nitrate/sulfonate/bicarbonate transport system ATPase subunit